jgi:hypothetical protein
VRDSRRVEPLDVAPTGAQLKPCNLGLQDGMKSPTRSRITSVTPNLSITVEQRHLGGHVRREFSHTKPAVVLQYSTVRTPRLWDVGKALDANEGRMARRACCVFTHPGGKSNPDGHDEDPARLALCRPSRRRELRSASDSVGCIISHLDATR